MKIRLEGTMDELNEAVRRVRETVFVQSVSKPYKNRNSDHYRIYVDAELWATTPNSETMEAIQEVQRMKVDPSIGKSYTDVNAMMEDLT